MKDAPWSSTPLHGEHSRLKRVILDQLTTISATRTANSGEVVETKGGNHKILTAWKEQYGAAQVEGWLQ